MGIAIRLDARAINIDIFSTSSQSVSLATLYYVFRRKHHQCPCLVAKDGGCL